MRSLSVPLSLYLLFAPFYAFAQTPTTFIGLANMLVRILNDGVVLMITAVIVVYFYGIVGRVYKSSQGETKGDMSSYLMWGIAIIFLMVSIWGVIQILQNTLFGPPPATNPNPSNVIMYNV